MSKSTYVNGIIPADEKFNKMYQLYKMCEETGVKVPDEVEKFFDYDTPDPNGMEVELPKDSFCELDVEYCDGYIIDLTKLPENIKMIKFTNSY